MLLIMMSMIPSTLKSVLKVKTENLNLLSSRKENIDSAMRNKEEL